MKSIKILEKYKKEYNLEDLDMPINDLKLLEDIVSKARIFFNTETISCKLEPATVIEILKLKRGCVSNIEEVDYELPRL